MSQPPTSDQSVEPVYNWYRPTMWHLLYAMALLGASLAAFGVNGIAIGAGCVLAWAYVYSHRSRPRALKQVAILGAVLGIMWMLSPRPSNSYPPTRMCQHNLRQLAVALSTYRQVNGNYPPPYIADSQGRPMHSWRVLVMPYLERQAFYDAYDFSQPWDSPANLKLAQQEQIEFLSCPSHPPAQAGYMHYFAVVGPRTVWPPDAPAGPAWAFDMPADGGDRTLLLIEDPSRLVIWTEPSDIGYAEAIQMISATDRRGPHPHSPNYTYSYYNAAFADTSISRVGQGTTAEDAAAILCQDDGADKSLAAFQRATARPEVVYQSRTGWRITQRHLQWLIFLLVVCFPLPWVWRRKSITA